MTVHPSWADVSIPQSIVYSVNELPPCYFMDSLVHQLVYRHKRKPQFTYTCQRCGFAYRPEQSSEEIACCQRCSSMLLRVVSNWRWGKEVPCYSRKNTHKLQGIIGAMRDLYITYFGTPAATIINCGWEDDYGYCQFSGGDKVYDRSVRMCIVKSAVLCPYIWDMSFDWSQPPHEDTVNTEHISPILNNYCHSSLLISPPE